MRTLKNANRADITYELASNEGKLANDDKEKLFKLLKKIEDGKSVSKKFKKPGYSPRKILLTKVVYSHEGRKDIFTLLHHAEFCKNKQAVEDLLEEAKKHELFDKVNNEKIISEYLTSDGKPIRTYSVVEDGVVKVKALDGVGSDAEGIQDTAVSTEQEPNASDSSLSKLCFDSDTADKEEKPLTKAKQKRKVITIDPKLKEKFIDDLVWEEKCKESLNTSVIEHATEFLPSIGDSEATDNELIHEKNAPASTETAIQKLSASDIIDKDNTSFSTKNGSVKLCFDGKPSKGNTVNKKERPLTQQRQAIMIGSAGAVLLLVGGVASYIMKMHVITVIGVIVGLSCIGFSLYNLIKPNTQLEKIEQPIDFFESKGMIKNP